MRVHLHFPLQENVFISKLSQHYGYLRDQKK